MRMFLGMHISENETWAWHIHAESCSIPIFPQKIEEIWDVNENVMKLQQIYGRQHTDGLQHGLVWQLECPGSKKTRERQTMPSPSQVPTTPPLKVSVGGVASKWQSISKIHTLVARPHSTIGKEVYTTKFRSSFFPETSRFMKTTHANFSKYYLLSNIMGSTRLQFCTVLIPISCME